MLVTESWLHSFRWRWHCLSDIVDVIEALGYNMHTVVMTSYGKQLIVFFTMVLLSDRNTIVCFHKRKMGVQIIQIIVAKVDTSHGWVQFIDNTITNDLVIVLLYNQPSLH
ncbi:MAG: hypothetical protein CM15mV13_3230 [uncultured marine virus]|nr:MAG: hypothetical protein CM15mV13_3230 [uncultured marine virus]